MRIGERLCRCSRSGTSRKFKTRPDAQRKRTGRKALPKRIAAANVARHTAQQKADSENLPPRRLHDLAHDFQRRILAGTDLRLFEKFVWQKQTTERMQGAYPAPGNNLACNTTETITVYVKPGARRSYGRQS
jgi:hypothetical protein